MVWSWEKYGFAIVRRSGLRDKMQWSIFFFVCVFTWFLIKMVARSTDFWVILCDNYSHSIVAVVVVNTSSITRFIPIIKIIIIITFTTICWLSIRILVSYLNFCRTLCRSSSCKGREGGFEDTWVSSIISIIGILEIISIFIIFRTTSSMTALASNKLWDKSYWILGSTDTKTAPKLKCFHHVLSAETISCVTHGASKNCTAHWFLLIFSLFKGMVRFRRFLLRLFHVVFSLSKEEHKNQNKTDLLERFSWKSRYSWQNWSFLCLFTLFFPFHSPKILPLISKL